jgi:hypothetical protein
MQWGFPSSLASVDGPNSGATCHTPLGTDASYCGQPFAAACLAAGHQNRAKNHSA